MTTENRLAKRGSGSPGKSAIRARQWAAMADAKGLKKVAEAWRKADEEGWDEDHFCPLLAEEYWRKIEEAQVVRR